MLLIQASNIHSGGGATLLRPLLQVPFPHERRVWVDSRFQTPAPLASGVKLIYVDNSIISRAKADAEIARQASVNDVLLCLGNLPPIHRTICKTAVYLQNRYLVDSKSLTGIPFKQRARLTAERIWLRSFVSHAQLYLVQTPTMKQAILRYLKLDENQVEIAPFFPNNARWPRSLSAGQNHTHNDDLPFLYVASGECHKNHRTLVQAWIQLANEGLYPALQLTLNKGRFPSLTEWIEKQASQFKLRITVDAAIGMPNSDMLYRTAGALIYPSLLESLGLPLIEARQAGLPVLAPELDYVRDVLDPDEVFDASSPKSIARAVQRFMGIKTPDLPTLETEQLLHLLCDHPLAIDRHTA